jgi:16S rRNA processing protein RimM
VDAIVVMGEVVGPYGIRGWLKVRSYAESPNALLGYTTWWLKPARGAGWSEFQRQGGRLHSGALVVALGGIDTREAALAMKGYEVGVPRRALPAVAQGEFYWADLAGLEVYNRSGVLLGEVSGITQHGAHPLLRVARPRQSPGAERLIPFVAAIVDRVDVDAGRIDVDWGVDY